MNLTKVFSGSEESKKVLNVTVLMLENKNEKQ